MVKYKKGSITINCEMIEPKVEILQPPIVRQQADIYYKNSAVACPKCGNTKLANGRIAAAKLRTGKDVIYYYCRHRNAKGEKCGHRWKEAVAK